MAEQHKHGDSPHVCTDDCFKVTLQPDDAEIEKAANVIHNALADAKLSVDACAYALILQAYATAKSSLAMRREDFLKMCDTLSKFADDEGMIVEPEET